MPPKPPDKAYSKALAVDVKRTLAKMARDDKSKAQNIDEPGGWTADGYRKHPFHKPSWGPYPTIQISKQEAAAPPSKKKLDQGKVQSKLMALIEESTQPKHQQAGRVEKDRSAGNVSIRDVLERLEKKKDKSRHYRAKTIKLPFIIRYLAKYSLYWEALNYLNIVVTCFLTAFYAFFCFYEQNISEVLNWMDFMFAADTIVRLLVEVWRSKTAATVVVFTAPYTMIQFLLDLISMAPFQHVYFAIEGSEELSDISMIERFTINRFVRLYRCVKFFETLKRQRMVNEKLLFLFKFSNYYFAFIILTACLLIFSIGATPMDYLLYKKVAPKLRRSYLSDFQKNKLGYQSNPLDIFVITLNFATAVITTVGYGDVIPNNELEMAICIVCMLFGAIYLNGQFTGELTNFEVEIDGARFDLYYRVREIQNFLLEIKTRAFFNARVMEYYNYLWTYREGVFDVSIMRALPQSFHEELLFDICKEMFDKSLLFFNLDPSFLRALSKICTIALYNSNMVLCRKGKHASKLFYILQGECHALSKLNAANASAIFRAGSLIGETNLIFSYPYTTTVETRTCCQFIILTKYDLFQVIDMFPTEFEIVRSRSLAKIKELHNTHQAYGVDPVCWVKARTDLDNPSKPNAEKLRRNMRWASGINREVVEDVVDDSEENVIFSTPCSDPGVVKDHLIPYISCAVPEIMKTTILWIKAFNLIIMSVALWYAFFGPYCMVFGQTSNFDWYICATQHYLRYAISLVFAADVFVEIIGACPVAGWYYRFWDGLHVVIHRATFYLDVLAALPFDLFTNTTQSYCQIIGTVFKVLKLWKVIRFLHYLDEVYPLQVFWFRLGETIIVLIYGIHFIACISYNLACPFDQTEHRIVCTNTSWLASYQISYKGSDDVPVYMRTTTLGYGSPYLYSFFYSAATLTSAGFGDFNPQTRREMLWAIGFMLFGFYLIGYYTAVLTSALSCLVRPKLALQQRLVSLYQFMNHYNLREHLKHRIVEYFVLQHQFRGGVPLESNKHIMYDAPAYLRNDVLFLETHELLDGVPIFSKLEAEIIIKLSACLHRFIIPPNTTFVMKGEVRRILYIIKHGSMGVFTSDHQFETPSTILESTCHFGLRDLLFGEPCHNTYRSLSYVALYSIKRKDFEECLQYEEDFWDLVSEERDRIKDVIHEMTMIYSNLSGKDYVTKDEATRIPSWIVIPPRMPPTALKVLGQVNTGMIKQVNLMNDEYDGLFSHSKGTGCFKLFLLRQAVHPVGYFSKFWNCLMSLICCLTVITLTLETFCYLRMPWFRLFQISLDWFNYVDIYLKFHWAYFNPHNGMLITHPLKTAINYVINGSLVLDVAICAPIELLMWIFKLTTFLGYGRAATWYSRLRWIRFFQFKRIPVVFHITHEIFENRNTILLFLYIISTLFVCTIVSAIAQFVACPWEANDWYEGDEYRMPICQKSSWVAMKFPEADTNPGVISGVYRRWVLGLYYVSQVILVIGFGDMITLNKADIYLLIFMSIFGFLFMRCVIADMTAAEVDSDETRATFIENMKVLDLVMARENVPKKLVFTVSSHLRYTWYRSKGLQPRELFSELHPVLESELYRNLMGDKLTKIPIFRNFPPTVLSSLCRYMKTQYVLRGNRVMRFGNLEYEMCIINHGKVYIADRNLNYVCSLGPGDSFGECSVMYGQSRRYNAIAATNLEIYVLSAAHCENFLGRYPNFRVEMKRNLFFEKRDYFESVLEKKMIKARALTNEQKTRMLHTFEQRTAVVKRLISLREDLELSGLNKAEVKNMRGRNRFIGYGDLDENLPLLYFTHGEGRKRRCCNCNCFVIHPNSGLIRRFIFLISWLCFVTPAIAAYEVCFSKEFLSSQSASTSSSFKVSKYLHKISDMIEWVFLFYIVLQFFLAYEIKPGLFNKSFCRIFLRYATAADGLLYDLLGCAPFIIEKTFEYMHINYTTYDNIWETVLQNLSLLRSIRLYKYFKTQLGKKNDLDVSTFKLQITLSVTSFCLMAHMLACLFYKISPCTRPDLSNSTFKFSNLCPPPSGDDVLDKNGWTTQFTITHEIKTTKDRLEAWRWWFRSLYWVVTTISTTGFGDIAPTTINEMAVGIICIFCGAFILSIILSQFTSGMASLTKTHREYMYQVLLLAKHLRNIGLSSIRQSHVMMYFLTMWNCCRGVPYHKTFHHLPISMQIEVAYVLFGKTLNKVPFFTDSKEQIFIRQLCLRVVHSLYIPGIYIHKDGDPGDTLFIVYKGVVSGTELTQTDENPPLVTIYNPGDSFGRFAALFSDGTYKKCYRAECMVEILEVKQSDILHLAKRFPIFKRKVMNYIASRYSPRGTNVNIFEKKRRKGMVMGAGTELRVAQDAQRQTATKAPEQKNQQAKEQRKKKLAEKQKKVLPKEPSIVVKHHRKASRTSSSSFTSSASSSTVKIKKKNDFVDEYYVKLNDMNDNDKVKEPKKEAVAEKKVKAKPALSQSSGKLEILFAARPLVISQSTAMDGAGLQDKPEKRDKRASKDDDAKKDRKAEKREKRRSKDEEGGEKKERRRRSKDGYDKDDDRRRRKSRHEGKGDDDREERRRRRKSSKSENNDNKEERRRRRKGSRHEDDNERREERRRRKKSRDEDKQDDDRGEKRRRRKSRDDDEGKDGQEKRRHRKSRDEDEKREERKDRKKSKTAVEEDGEKGRDKPRRSKDDVAKEGENDRRGNEKNSKDEDARKGKDDERQKERKSKDEGKEDDDKGESRPKKKSRDEEGDDKGERRRSRKSKDEGKEGDEKKDRRRSKKSKDEGGDKGDRHGGKRSKDEGKPDDDEKEKRRRKKSKDEDGDDKEKRKHRKLRDDDDKKEGKKDRRKSKTAVEEDGAKRRESRRKSKSRVEQEESDQGEGKTKSKHEDETERENDKEGSKKKSKHGDERKKEDEKKESKEAVDDGKSLKNIETRTTFKRETEGEDDGGESKRASKHEMERDDGEVGNAKSATKNKDRKSKDDKKRKQSKDEGEKKSRGEGKDEDDERRRRKKSKEEDDDDNKGEKRRKKKSKDDDGDEGEGDEKRKHRKSRDEDDKKERKKDKRKSAYDDDDNEGKGRERKRKSKKEDDDEGEDDKAERRRKKKSKDEADEGGEERERKKSKDEKKKSKDQKRKSK